MCYKWPQARFSVEHFEERRKHFRVKANAKVGWKSQDDGHEVSGAEMEDISQSGIKVTAKKKPATGSKLAISINLGTGKDLKLTAEVVRVESAKNKPAYYDIGIKFSKLDIEHVKLLQEFILDQLSFKKTSKK
ncbi:MAG: PilZ domain-containing protein [Candidatus Omnitrophica bacterium]|nr:PilZ domain-containing protein [Candidatus Omnitrophota bacterium]